MSSVENQVAQGISVTQVQANQPTSTAGAQLAVTYQLHAQPTQQPAQVVMAQPTQPPVQVQMAPAVQPQPQVMFVQGPQVQQQPMAMRVPTQQIPQAQVQYIQQPAYGQPLASGSVAYTAQPQSGVPQVIMNPGYFNQPNFNYTPNSFLILSIIMGILCGLFSPATLTCTIPAIFFSLKSKNSSRVGNIKQAKREGLYALTWIIIAILGATIIAIIFTGIFTALGRSFNCNSYYGYRSNSYNYIYYC